MMTLNPKSDTLTNIKSSGSVGLTANKIFSNFKSRCTISRNTKKLG